MGWRTVFSSPSITWSYAWVSTQTQAYLLASANNVYGFFSTGIWEDGPLSKVVNLVNPKNHDMSSFNQKECFATNYL